MQRRLKKLVENILFVVAVSIRVLIIRETVRLVISFGTIKPHFIFFKTVFPFESVITTGAVWLGATLYLASTTRWLILRPSTSEIDVWGLEIA